MANPSNVYAVDCDVTPVTEETYEYQTVTTTQDYYPNEMIGVNGSELADKFDDTQSLRFVGIHAGSARLRIKSDSNANERLITVKKPRYITMYISSATAGTDEGKPVYAAYSNQVQFATGTYGNYVGLVKKVISSTLVQIDTMATHQTHDNTALTLAATGTQTLTRNHINRRIFVPNTAAITINLPAIAKLPVGAWMEFLKTSSDAYAFTLDGNASETINGATTYASSTLQYDSIRIVYNGSEWQTVGEVGAFGATTFSGDVTLGSGSNLIFSGTTGQSEINLTDNLADSLSVNISGGNDFLVFDTTDSNEKLYITPGTGQKLSFFNVTPIVKYNTTGDQTTGAAGSTTGVFLNTTFTGNNGSTAYKIGDVVAALKGYGLLTV